MWTNRSRLIFVSCLFITGFILLQMGMYALHLLFGREISFNIFQLCNSWLKSMGFITTGYFLGGLVLYTLGMCLWMLGKQLFLSQRMYRKLLRDQPDISSVQQATKMYVQGAADIHLVSSTQPMAFTMGYLKPRIFVTTGLLQLLDNDEIKAVLYHERQHQQSADPLKTLVLSLCASMFWYIPLLKWMLHHYKIAREIVADQYAIQQLGSSMELGSALLKLVKKSPAFTMPFTYASFADTSVNYRISQILDPQAKISFKPPLTSTLISLQIIALISILFVFNLY